MAAILQHPAGIHAPALAGGEAGFGADGNPEEGQEGYSVLGQVPHRIHGRLAGFSQSCLTGQAFSQCTACSACVVEQYKQHGWQFLQHALQVHPPSRASRHIMCQDVSLLSNSCSLPSRDWRLSAIPPLYDSMHLATHSVERPASSSHRHNHTCILPFIIAEHWAPAHSMSRKLPALSIIWLSFPEYQSRSSLDIHIHAALQIHNLP